MNFRPSLPAAGLGLAAVLVLGIAALAQGGAQETFRRSLSGRIGSEGDSRLLKPNLASAPLLGSEGLAVTTDHGYLFVVRGSRVYKLDESNLAVVATSRLDNPTSVRHSQPKTHRKRGTRSRAETVR